MDFSMTSQYISPGKLVSNRKFHGNNGQVCNTHIYIYIYINIIYINDILYIDIYIYIIY